jgi:cytosine/adenosine deaminase-related metal-dependent hydrolase
MPTRTLVLKNCRAIATMNDERAILRDSDVVIDGPVIKSVGRVTPPAGADVIDCAGKVVLPGFVNTHHHLFQILTRNLPAVQNATLFDWLVHNYEIWRGITPDAVYAAARCGLAELLLTGCTTAADHHYLFPRGASRYLLDETIRAARELGIRFHPTRGSMSLGHSRGGLPPDDLVEDDDDILRDCQRVIDHYHDARDLSMCRVALAPCSPFNVSPELLQQTADLGRQHQLRLHTHLCETLDEEQYCLEKYHKRPLDFMESLGWLGDDIWFAHVIHVNDTEIARLGRARTGIAHCPSSNLRLGSGIAPIRALLTAGSPVGVAVDGSSSNDSSNMLLEVRLAMLVQRIKAGVQAMPALDALWLATRGGAAVLGRSDIGCIAPGRAADIALFDVTGLPYAGAQSDPVAAVLFCGIDQRAWMTIVHGRIVVREKQLVSADANEIAAATNAAAARLIDTASART